MIIIIISVIKEEEKETRAEVKSFDKKNLKHVETQEKETLPTAQGKERSKKSCLIL